MWYWKLKIKYRTYIVDKNGVVSEKKERKRKIIQDDDEEEEGEELVRNPSKGNKQYLR